MKKLFRAHSWESRLADKQAEMLAASGAEREKLSERIAALEKAISIRNSLSAAKTPRGTIEFSI